MKTKFRGPPLPPAPPPQKKNMGIQIPVGTKKNGPGTWLDYNPYQDPYLPTPLTNNNFSYSVLKFSIDPERFFHPHLEPDFFSSFQADPNSGQDANRDQSSSNKKILVQEIKGGK